MKNHKGKRKFGQKRFHRKAIKSKFGKDSLVNTKYAQYHHLPMATKYFTTLEGSFTGILAANNTAAQGTYCIVASDRQIWSTGFTSQFYVSESAGNPQNASCVGFANLSNMYQFYRLLASKLTIEIIMQGPPGGDVDGGPDVLQLALAPFSSPVYANRSTPRFPYVFEMDKAPWGKSLIINGMNGTGYHAKLEQYVKTKDLYGVPGIAVMTEDNYAGYTYSSDGSNQINPVTFQFNWVTDNAVVNADDYVNENCTLKFTIKNFYCFDVLRNAIANT